MCLAGQNSDKEVVGLLVEWETSVLKEDFMGNVEKINHLDNAFYATPSFHKQVMTYKEVRETFVATEGYVMSCGERWEIKSKHLGAGMYRVTLARTYLPKNAKAKS